MGRCVTLQLNVSNKYVLWLIDLLFCSIPTCHQTINVNFSFYLYIPVHYQQTIFSVSRGLNEVRGGHDDEQQSARPGARREARVVRRASREGARRNVRPDAPDKNYAIKHNTLIMNKTNNKICIIAMLSLYAAH